MLERRRIEPNDRVILPGFVVTPEMYANVLFVLTDGSKNYIAELHWQHKWFGRKAHYTAICESETALARRSDGRYELLIPESHTLCCIYLIVTYQDDSLLRIHIGLRDRGLVVRPGSAGEARRRLEEAREVLGTRRAHPDVIAGWVLASAAVFIAVLLGIMGKLLGAAIVAMITLIPVYLLNRALNGGFLRPRPSRLGTGWQAIGFGKADLRNLIIGVVGGLLLASILALLRVFN